MKILLLSPYDALSHQYWWSKLCQGLADHEFVVVTLQARFFSWRFRGNSLTLSQREELKQSFDLIIATSMTDLATLKGLTPSIEGVPVILYFHENQFAYPDESNAAHQVERQITQLYSAIAADQLVFNSSFNQESFFEGVATFLAKMPDGVPSGVVERLRQKVQVISVPVEEHGPMIEPTADNLPAGQDAANPLQIVWNHRWEHDKGIEELDRLLEALLSVTRDFKVHLIGQSFRNKPKTFSQLIQRLEDADVIGRIGFIEDRSEYLTFLQRCDLVLSTARHEFQGLAVLEAMAAGCMPVVPNALAYTEFVSEQWRYNSVAEAVELIVERSRHATGDEIGLPKTVTMDTVSQNWRSLLGRMF